jgi:putative transposase
MANTFFCLHYHIVFSTKGRRALLKSTIKNRTWAYLSAIVRDHGGAPHQVGGTDNHVHVLAEIPPKLAVSEMLRRLKGGSSKWMHETFPDLRGFGWQDGFAAFGVSKSNVEDVVTYIRNQEMHHHKCSFEDELKMLLEKHGVSYDEKYLLD